METGASATAETEQALPAFAAGPPATFGGVRVMRDNGRAFDFEAALLREFVIRYLFFYTPGSLFLYIPPLLDSLWPLWDDENRALHDMVASTHVVRA